MSSEVGSDLVKGEHVNKACVYEKGLKPACTSRQEPANWHRGWGACMLPRGLKRIGGALGSIKSHSRVVLHVALDAQAPRHGARHAVRPHLRRHGRHVWGGWEAPSPATAAEM